MPKVVNFHLPANDVDRAVTFYRNVFGWDFAAFPDSPVPYVVHAAAGEGGAGVPAAIVARSEVVRAPVPTIDVPDIDQALIAVVTNGGQQARVQTLPSGDRFGYAIDSEGNVIALMQRA